MKIVHETQRGRFSFAAHAIQAYLSALPDIELTLDISHWFNVAESFLTDQTEAVTEALSRIEHIHARVGFPQGPQIPDPRAPEWQDALQYHLSIWDRIIQRVRGEDRDHFTVTPEFGPAPYMTLQPLTKMPISNQWQINVYMKDLLTERYQIIQDKGSRS